MTTPAPEESWSSRRARILARASRRSIDHYRDMANATASTAEAAQWTALADELQAFEQTDPTPDQEAML